jgi:hypothetical protein
MPLKHYKVSARFTAAVLAGQTAIFEDHSLTRDLWAENPEQAQQDFLDELELDVPVYTLHKIKVWEVK